MALDEQEEVREHLEETQEGGNEYLDDRRQQVGFHFQCDRLVDKG
jgi:hypothetical protein